MLTGGRMVMLAAIAGLLPGCGSEPLSELELDPLRGCRLNAVEGDQRPTTAAELAELAGYRTIDGSLTLLATSITDLDDLACLREITGTLWLIANEELTSLRGLEQLTSVGFLRIEANPELTHIDLPGLAALPGEYSQGGLGVPPSYSPSLAIGDNPKLVSIALPALTSMDQPASIQANPMLASIEVPVLTTSSSLELADSAATALSFPVLEEGWLAVRRHPQLTAIEVPVLAGSASLTIEDNARLTELSFSFTSLGGLEVSGNQTLTAVRLPNAGQLGGLTISDNPALQVVELPRLASTGGLWVSDAPLLTSLALPRLETVTGQARIHQVPLTTLDLSALRSAELLWIDGTRLSAFPAVQADFTARSLMASSNAEMVSMGSFGPGLELEGLSLYRNPKLSDLSTLSAVPSYSLTVVENGSLTDLGAVSPAAGSASEPGLIVRIEGNAQLEDLSALTPLVKAGRVEIRNNGALQSLVALANMEQAAQLFIVGNPALTELSMSSLMALVPAGELRIMDNASLPTCAAEALRDQVALPGSTGSWLTISGNDDNGTCD